MLYKTGEQWQGTCSGLNKLALLVKQTLPMITPPFYNGVSQLSLDFKKLFLAYEYPRQPFKFTYTTKFSKVLSSQCKF